MDEFKGSYVIEVIYWEVSIVPFWITLGDESECSLPDPVQMYFMEKIVGKFSASTYNHKIHFLEGNQGVTKADHVPNM